MAKIILTVFDDEDGDVTIRTNFEPALSRNIQELTDAQHIALEMLGSHVPAVGDDE